MITAYDVDPYRGSESATGWNYPLHLSKDYKITLVTRKNNLTNIFKYINENKISCDNINFIGMDLPYWARFWKRGARGSFLYYYLWQAYIALMLRPIKHQFDLCHALNFHCDWAPSFLWLLGKPFIWGPINHNEPLPKYYIEKLGLKYKIQEKIKFIFKQVFWVLDPFLFICKLKADRILVGHDKVIDRLNLSRKKCILFNQIATNMPVSKVHKSFDGIFSILFVGRGLKIKNYMSVIEGFIKAFGANVCNQFLELNLVGVGKEEALTIRRFVNKLDSNLVINVVDWVERKEVDAFYNRASVFCFPSYEGAGMVIAEALSYSLPIITIDRNGASHELDDSCSFILSGNTYNDVIKGISESLSKLENNRAILRNMSRKSGIHALNNLTWSVKAERIANIYSTF
ncbi:glycosyltransferase family 4 protein [Thalassotalea sp. G20_0]|uniref:glycosyltransferase family 4 protein n=1 Tax=Thalassotalea sp. G20_0 TaxID=2821093 RepID=UPI001ADAF75D|nr:glycosyltransferase family 4 protein [Thalassotalea sp. G20_0]MBO9496920.1 glycosyltransferase family 4 protein [Thalassotalea sp. G20_0]